MLTDDARRTMDDAQRTTHDDGRQPIAIGHLSDSGDLKKMEGKVICLFDKTHVIRVERFPRHVRKCEKSNPTTAKKLEKCIYVNCHRFLKGQGKEHYEECEGKIYSEGSTRPVRNKGDTSLPQYKDL